MAFVHGFLKIDEEYSYWLIKRIFCWANTFPHAAMIQYYPALELVMNQIRVPRKANFNEFIRAPNTW